MMSLTKLMSPPNFNGVVAGSHRDGVGKLPTSFIRERDALEELGHTEGETVVRPECLRRTSADGVGWLAGDGGWLN